jgi:hypothetical protein
VGQMVSQVVGQTPGATPNPTKPNETHETSAKHGRNKLATLCGSIINETLYLNLRKLVSRKNDLILLHIESIDTIVPLPGVARDASRRALTLTTPH